MRYIGNKTSLLYFLEETFNEMLGEDEGSINKFYDLFSGTGAVAEKFKTRFNVVGNDLLSSSYLITKVRLMNKQPKSKKLNKIFEDLNEVTSEGFITKKYSEGGDRLYFSKLNGQKIDGIRIHLNKLKDEKKITLKEYEYIIYCLLEAVHKVSNTTGVYGAYLKKLGSNGTKELKLEKLEIVPSSKKHNCFNNDCIDLLEEIQESDIVYLDPPYNSRQYGSNYHLLETITKYEEPEIKIVKKNKETKESVSGLPKDLPSSKWCKKSEIKEELKKVLNCKSKYIFMSYNNEGLISEEELKELFEEYGKLVIKRKKYKKYKSNKRISPDKEVKEIEELLFCLLK